MEGGGCLLLVVETDPPTAAEVFVEGCGDSLFGGSDRVAVCCIAVVCVGRFWAGRGDGFSAEETTSVSVEVRIGISAVDRTGRFSGKGVSAFSIKES